MRSLGIAKKPLCSCLVALLILSASCSMTSTTAASSIISQGRKEQILGNERNLEHHGEGDTGNDEPERREPVPNTPAIPPTFGPEQPPSPTEAPAFYFQVPPRSILLLAAVTKTHSNPTL